MNPKKIVRIPNTVKNTNLFCFRCDLEAGKDSYNPEELVCGGCSDVSQVEYMRNIPTMIGVESK